MSAEKAGAVDNKDNPKKYEKCPGNDGYCKIIHNLFLSVLNINFCYPAQHNIPNNQTDSCIDQNIAR